MFQGIHQSYASADGRWQDVTPDEIKRLIGLLIYFGLVKVVGSLEKYWSKKTLLSWSLGKSNHVMKTVQSNNGPTSCCRPSN